MSDDIRGLVGFGLLLDELPFGVDREQASVGDPHLLVGKCVLRKKRAAVMQTDLRNVIFLSVGSLAYVGPVAKGSVEGLPLWVEQVPDVAQTGDFKNLRLLLDDLSGKHKAVECSSARRTLMYPSVQPCLCRAEKRLLGASSTGPLGRTVPPSLTHWR